MSQHIENTERAELVETLVRAGSAWARYGLSMGRIALETSARTLSETARALDTLSDRLEDRLDGDDDDESIVGVRRS